MSIVIDLPPQVEDAYREYARAKGQAVDEVVREVVIAGKPALAPANRVSPDEWARQVDGWTGLEELPEDHDPTRREDMYPDRW